jgi:hypothetical protein
MPVIYVKTKPGRRAFFEGKIIPEDKFVPVTENSYTRRLIDHWEDLEEQGGKKEKTKAKIVAAHAAPSYAKKDN